MKEFNPFYTTGLIPYPLKASENLPGFLMFSGGIEKPAAWNGLIEKNDKNFFCGKNYLDVLSKCECVITLSVVIIRMIPIS